MRERRPLLLGVAVFALLVGAGSGLTSPVGAQVPLASGRFVSVCEFSHQSMNDPIVYPGKPGKSHLHEFFGNASTNAYSTPKSLLHHRRTSCTPRGNRSGYWVPALEIDGKVVRPLRAHAYYSSGGRDPQSIQMTPPGLEMLAGDSHATQPQRPRIGGWACVSGRHSHRSVPTPSCPRNDTLALVVRFPDCWDGKHRNSPDHKSHLAYSRTAASRRWRTCPSRYPVPIPMIALRVIYPTNGARSGIELSSGGIYSYHADFMDGWKRSVLRRLLDSCIHRARVCSR